MTRRAFHLALFAFLPGCALFTPSNVDHAEEAARAACIVANAFLPDDEILRRCNLALDFLDVVRRVAGETRSGVTRAGLCGASPVLPSKRDPFGVILLHGTVPNP